MSLRPPTEQQARLIWLAISGLAAAVLVGLAVAAVWGLGRVLQILAPVLWPLAVAGVVACLLDPVVDWFQRKGLSRAKSVAAVFAMGVVIVLALFGSIVPQLISETRTLAVRVPEYSTELQKKAEAWVNHPPSIVRKWLKSAPVAPVNHSGSVSSNTNAAVPGASVGAAESKTGADLLGSSPISSENLGTAAEWAATALREAGLWLFGRVATWAGIIASLALVPVYAFYFLLEKRGISSRWTEYLPVSDSRFKDELVFVLNAINGYLIAFFRGQVLVAICDGVLYSLGFLVIGVPYALLIGALAIGLTMIPFIGAFVTCGLALVIALVQYGDWQHPLMVLGVFGTVQALEGLVISPRIMGDRVGLHPLTIMIAVMTGTTLLGGLLGGILAIPLTAALRVLMFRYVWKRER
jgi:predicted PurR-regulated permease PerM